MDRLTVIAAAEKEHLVLKQQHWQVLAAVEEFHTTYKIHPTMRALVNILKNKYPEENYDSIKLQLLFPNEFMRQVHRLVGLDEPGCG